MCDFRRYKTGLLKVEFSLNPKLYCLYDGLTFKSTLGYVNFLLKIVGFNTIEKLHPNRINMLCAFDEQGGTFFFFFFRREEYQVLYIPFQLNYKISIILKQDVFLPAELSGKT